jgi:hypothetical protein
MDSAVDVRELTVPAFSLPVPTGATSEEGPGDIFGSRARARAPRAERVPAPAPTAPAFIPKELKVDGVPSEPGEPPVKPYFTHPTGADEKPLPYYDQKTHGEHYKTIHRMSSSSKSKQH